MDVVTEGAVITVKNSFNRLKDAFIWFLRTAGGLLLRIPLASLSFLARVGNYLLDGKNRKIAIVILVTAGAIIVCRTLVSRANQRRHRRESKNLFPRFHSRFTSHLNLADADDEELLKAAWDIEQYIKSKNIMVDSKTQS